LTPSEPHRPWLRPVGSGRLGQLCRLGLAGGVLQRAAGAPGAAHPAHEGCRLLGVDARADAEGLALQLGLPVLDQRDDAVDVGRGL
jgi:hypothetical protein